MAGLSAALMLGRAGHDVVRLDRDSVFRKCNWEESLLDKREGIAHFFQAHVFWPRGRTLFKKRRRFRVTPASQYPGRNSAGRRGTDLRWRAPGFDRNGHCFKRRCASVPSGFVVACASLGC
jgi:2-polyprenyl-6-methoxyphenol hydroxylase-like FAD-dependent oxidoreductase